MDRKVVIAHLSDLHLGKEESEAKINNLLGALKGLSPDYVIISGDIFDDVCLKKKCRQSVLDFFKKLEECIGSKNIITVPGNHDLRRFGIFKPLIEKRCEDYKHLKYIEDFHKLLFDYLPFLPSECSSELELPSGVDLKHLADKIYYNSNEKLLILKEVILPKERDELLTLLEDDSYKSAIKKLFEECWSKAGIVFRFNSALGGAFAQGEIGNKALSQFEECVKEITPYGGYGLKIAVLHHHPLPVPFSNTEVFHKHKPIKNWLGRIKDQEGFLILNKSGSSLYRMWNAGVDIVLHGHMHVRSFAEWSCIEEGGEVKGKIFVAAPGSPFAPNDNRPYSFNVITVHPDRFVEITCYETPHPEQQFSLKKTILVNNYEGIKEKHYQWARKKKEAIRCKKVSYEWKISENGDCDLKAEVELEEGCMPKEFPVVWQVKPGQISQEKSRVNAVPSTVSWKDTSSHDCLIGKLMLEYERNFSYTFRQFNTFTMDEQEAYVLYGEPTPVEKVRYVVEYPIAALESTIKLPYTFELKKKDVELFIYEGEERRTRWEEEEKNKNLIVDEEKREITLNVSRPFYNCTYEINWKLQKGPERSEPLAQIAREIRERLLLCHPVGKELKDSLEKRVRQKIIEIANMKKGEEKLEDITLTVLDEKKKITVISSCLSPDDGDTWKIKIPPGIGHVWWVMKNRRMAYFENANRKNFFRHIYIHLTASVLEGLNIKFENPNFFEKRHEVLISWPLVVGKELLGVLTVGSDQEGSLLKNLAFECINLPAERKKVRDSIIKPLLVDIVKICGKSDLILKYASKEKEIKTADPPKQHKDNKEVVESSAPAKDFAVSEEIAESSAPAEDFAVSFEELAKALAKPAGQ